MIDSLEISVVVQGGIDPKLTPITLQSIKTILPNAQVILSTWNSNITHGLKYDVLVTSEDPGFYYADHYKSVRNNINRQIVSTRNGLLKADRKYVLKIRSDMKLVSTNFINYFGKYDGHRNENLKLFENRVIFNNLYSVDSNKKKILFHVSDWVQFGLKKDLLNLWDINLEEPREASQYFLKNIRPTLSLFPDWLNQYLPEQYLWKSFLLKNTQCLDFNNYLDYDPKLKEISDISIANNTVILDYKSYGVEFLKYDPYKWDYKTCLKFHDWLLLYKMYCNRDLNLTLLQKLKILDSEKLEFYKIKIIKNYKLFATPFEYIYRFFRSPFLLILYGLMFSVHLLIYLFNKKSHSDYCNKSKPTVHK